MEKFYIKIVLGRFKKIALAVAFCAMLPALQSFKPGSPFSEPGFQAKTVKCYPNPAVSFINFEFKTEFVSKDYSLNVYSFTGKKMFEINITSTKAILTFTNDFYRGIYVYQLHDKSGKIIETGKFQVVK